MPTDLDAQTDADLVSDLDLDRPEAFEPITDEELTALALAADVDEPIAENAVPFDACEQQFGDLLPDWYMPAPAAGLRRRRHSVTAAVIVLSLLGVNAVGLCVTNGFLEIAW